MKTISSVVEQYIKSKPFLLSSLSQGIINLTSLARIMMPELEAHLGKDVKQGAVVMSLKRLSEELDFKINYKISKVLKKNVNSERVSPFPKDIFIFCIYYPCFF